MYLVIATHNTGHGEVSTPVLLTDDMTEAIGRARDAEVLGFRFFTNGSGVVVYKVEQGHLYDQLGNSPKLIFWRRLVNVPEQPKKWVEELPQ